MKLAPFPTPNPLIGCNGLPHTKKFLKKLLKQAIAKEKYEDAKIYSDEINRKISKKEKKKITFEILKKEFPAWRVGYRNQFFAGNLKLRHIKGYKWKLTIAFTMWQQVFDPREEKDIVIVKRLCRQYYRGDTVLVK